MGLGILVPRNLGEHIAFGKFGLQPVDDVGKLYCDVQQHRTDYDVGQAVVDRQEVPPKRVPVEDVEKAGEQLHQSGRDQERNGNPLDNPLYRTKWRFG